MPVARVVNLTKALEGLKERGYYVVGLDGGGDKLVGETGFESDPLVVVLGSEGSGLGRLVRETCDAIAGIPISSSVESLNASVAAGISLLAVWLLLLTMDALDLTHFSFLPALLEVGVLVALSGVVLGGLLDYLALRKTHLT